VALLMFPRACAVVGMRGVIVAYSLGPGKAQIGMPHTQIASFAGAQAATFH